MSDYKGAPTSVPHVAGNSQMQELTPAQLITKYGAGNVKTPTKNFTLNWRGIHMQFYANIPVVCTPDVLAALAAIGAPVV